MSISISIELAEYLLNRHLDCVADGTGFIVPESIEPKIDKLYKSVGREKSRQRVRAKVASLPNKSVEPTVSTSSEAIPGVVDEIEELWAE